MRYAFLEGELLMGDVFGFLTAVVTKVNILFKCIVWIPTASEAATGLPSNSLISIAERRHNNS